MTNRSILELSPIPMLRPAAAILYRRLFTRPHSLLCALRVLCGEGSFSSRLASSNCQIPAKNENFTNIILQLSITIINNVGAPTYCIRFATGAAAFNSGPPQLALPHTNCELLTVNCQQNSPKHVFYREIIKYVGAPTFWSAAARRRFSVDTLPPNDLFGRNRYDRNSGSKLPHSKPTSAPHSHTSVQLFMTSLRNGGAPTSATSRTTTCKPRNRSEDRPLHKLWAVGCRLSAVGCELSTVNCELTSWRRRAWAGLIFLR